MAVGFADFLDGSAPCCGKTVGEVKFAGHFGYCELGGWVVDLVDPDGREADWRGYFVAEDLGGGVSLVGVY